MRISDWSSDVCSSGLGVRDAGGRPGLDYAEQRAALQSGGSHGQIYDAVGADIERELAAGRRVVLSAFSAGALDRLANLLQEHAGIAGETRSEEHTSELQSLMRISYAVFCLKKKNTKHNSNT